MWFERFSLLGDGNRNICFFHSHASSRQQRSTTRGIQNDCGDCIDNDATVLDVFGEYFTNLFTSNASVLVEGIFWGLG